MIVDSINIKGARQNNLKNINVIIPRNKLVILEFSIMKIFINCGFLK